MSDSDLFSNFEFEPKPAGEPSETLVMEALYGLLAEIRKLEPWKVFDNNHLIGICAGHDLQEMKIISTLGKAGEFIAIQLHKPPQGIAFHNAIAYDEDLHPGPGLVNLRFLDCEFVDQAKAERDELEAFQSFGNPKNLRNEVPSLRSYSPGFSPWDLDHNEVLELISAYRLYLHHFQEVADNLGTYYFWDEEDEMPHIPVLSLKQGADPKDPKNWQIVVREIPVAEHPTPPKPKSDGFHPDFEELDIEDEIWEFAITYLPDPVKGDPSAEDKRAYFPKLVAGMHDDPAGLVVVNPDIYTASEKPDAEAVQDFFHKFATERECLPALVRVPTEVERVALQGISHRLGIPIEVVELEFLPEFLDSLTKTNFDMSTQVQQLLDVLPPGNPIRGLLEEGRFDEAFAMVNSLMTGEAENIVQGDFGDVGGSN